MFRVGAHQLKLKMGIGYEIIRKKTKCLLGTCKKGGCLTQRKLARAGVFGNANLVFKIFENFLLF
jgi:hypothetical protein